MNRDEFEAAIADVRDDLVNLGLREELALERALDAALFGKQRVKIELEVEVPGDVRDRCDVEELAELYGVRSDHTDSSEVAAEIYRELLKRL